MAKIEAQTVEPAQAAQTKRPFAAGLVRDRDGKPRFDDIKGIPGVFWNQLTWEEQQDIISEGGYPSE